MENRELKLKTLLLSKNEIIIFANRADKDLINKDIKDIVKDAYCNNDNVNLEIHYIRNIDKYDLISYYDDIIIYKTGRISKYKIVRKEYEEEIEEPDKESDEKSDEESDEESDESSDEESDEESAEETEETEETDNTNVNMNIVINSKKLKNLTIIH
ncbi:uncharacterized protein LOC136080088 [Hydra vulgaris]|uniref:Uncharacterized protein LOC136080088 n=1 Tax=Hydra vulgaris TaxID=6087 RepID=A0ABM4BUC2_HYDVU